MDPREQDISGTHSADSIFENISRGDKTLEDDMLRSPYLETLEKIDPNETQINRILRALAQQDIRGTGTVLEDLQFGAAVAFNVVLKLAKNDTHIRNKLYAALGSFETQSINEADKTMHDRHVAIGRSTSAIIETNLLFASLGSLEEDFIYRIIAREGRDPASQLDAMVGYRLVRMAIPWAETRRQYVLAKLSTALSDAGRSHSDEVQDGSEDTAFFDLVGGLEVEDRILEGLEECDSDIAILNIRLEQYIEYMAQSNSDDAKVAEQVTASLLEAMFNEFMSLQHLKLRDTLTIVGNTVILVHNSQGDFKCSVPLTDGEVIRGEVTEPNIMSVPSQDYVDAAASKDEKLLKRTRKKSSQPFGLTFLLDDVTILRKDGTMLTFDSSDSVYLPIQHQGLKFYRDPYSVHD